MTFEGTVFQGPALTEAEADPELLSELPPELCELLAKQNGVVAFHGGLHLRGACKSPAWHSLRAAWKGEQALSTLYPELEPTDIPFAEDCVGDQYLLRSGQVIQLFAEMGEVEELELSLTEFLDAAVADPVDLLCTEPLELFLQENEKLEPGRLLHVHPPFCVDADERSVRDVPAPELLRFHVSLADQLRGLPEGAEITFEIVE